MLQSFAHRVFVILGTLCIFALLGWTVIGAVERGFFGDTPRLWLVQVQSSARDLWVRNQAEVDIGVRLSGALATLIGGIWTLHKGVYFANRQLPNRLAEYLDKREERLRRMLPLRVAELRRHQQVKRGDPILQYGPLSRALAKEALPPPRQFRADIQGIIGDLEKRAEIAARTAELIKTERISAHVLNSAAILAETTLLDKDKALQRQHLLGEALVELDKALKLDDGNLDALELVAELHRSSGNDDRNCLERFCEAANRAGDPSRKVKAFRMLAEHLADDPVTARVVEARAFVQSAIACLADMPDPSDRMKLERAQLHALAARIYRRLEKFGLMRKAVDTATKLFNELGKDDQSQMLAADTVVDPSDKDEATQVEG